MSSDFEPNILAFCCNYCAYAAADTAGISRMQYPHNVKIIRVPCSGKVDITHILHAFEGGADGVYVAGCLKGGCHFVEGNLHAEKRVTLAKNLLDAIGIGGERVEMFFISTSMAPKFVEVAKEFTEKIRKLGPAIHKKVCPTVKDEMDNKREFLYQILRNLAVEKPEKNVPVPEGLEEFGRIEFDLTKCIGCKKCEEICPEKAVESINYLDLPTIMKTPTEYTGSKVTKRQLLYQTLAKIAVKTPLKPVKVPEGMEEFSKIDYSPKKCVVCDKCSEICPEEVIKIVKEIDLPSILN
jgi:coenzyme F420-reducing hydrogenase delta subunit/formate hydrogenlyase subunit 6/NADH:ubiquinone oxidoreductase subunit I